MSRRALQVVLVAIGAVAVVAGTTSLLTGTATIPGGDDVSPSVDSEMRFYAAWYVAAGILLLRSVPRVEDEVFIVRTIAATFFGAACARVISIVGNGSPEPWYLFLMAVELIIPAVIIPWQAMVAGRDSAKDVP